jgi:hypothetical protein
MMPSGPIILRIGALLSVGLLLCASPSRAQMSMTGGGRSLGGYGTATISSYYGGGGGGYVPYNGRASGFVPYSGDFGGGIGSRPIPRRLPQTPIGGVMMAETPIGGATLSGSMGARGGMDLGSRSSGARTFLPFGYEGGIGMSGTMSAVAPIGAGGRRQSPAGPGFGYPFRMPPSLLSGSSSMAMP